MKKYKIWNCGQTNFSDEIPEDMPVIGVNGFWPISTRSHYHAAGYGGLIPETPEEVLNAPAFFNQPFAEIVEQN